MKDLTFLIGGEMEVSRLGYGAMRVTGPGIWGPPADREKALATMRRIPGLGINLIDTADSYGPGVSEPLIREALFPYPSDLRIATKAGLTRPGPDQWAPRGDPEYLLSQAMRSREALQVDRIDLWQLHRIDPRVPRDEQFAVIRQLLDTGVIRHAGLSEVSIDDIEAARAVFPVATVQNRYNLADRGSEDVLDYCDANGIGFIPWFPLAAGRLTELGTSLQGIAARHGVAPGQIAIAWLLQRSRVILPIPGTTSIKHLEENVRALSITLTVEEFKQLDAAGRSSAHL